MNAKQLQFVKEYTIDWNATQAAKRAGYSPKTAYAQGSALLKKLEIREALAERIAKLAMTQDEVLGRLGAMSRGELVTKRIGDIETHDSLAALEKVGKVHAMFVDKQIVEQIGLEIIDDDEDTLD